MTTIEKNKKRPQIILASQSPARLVLLKRIGIIPDQIIPAHLDEAAMKGETPKALALRLAVEKAAAIAKNFDDAVVIGSDTVPVVGRMIMRKASSDDDVREALAMLSGRRHQLYTGVSVIKKTAGVAHISKKVVKTIIKFKRITNEEIEYYVGTKEGIGNAGGYTLGGYAESFASYISGSFSNVIGLPLHETMNLLNSAGIYPYRDI